MAIRSSRATKPGCSGGDKRVANSIVFIASATSILSEHRRWTSAYTHIHKLCCTIFAESRARSDIGSGAENFLARVCAYSLMCSEVRLLRARGKQKKENDTPTCEAANNLVSNPRQLLGNTILVSAPRQTNKSSQSNKCINKSSCGVYFLEFHFPVSVRIFQA